MPAGSDPSHTNGTLNEMEHWHEMGYNRLLEIVDMFKVVITINYYYTGQKIVQ